jgi:hypothetical protein
MALDPSIILQGQPIRDPLESYGKALTLKGLAAQQQMQQNQLADYEQEKQQQRTLADLYRSSSAGGQLDRNALISGAAQQGLGARIPALQKSFADLDKSQADVRHTTAQTDETQIKAQKQRLDIAGGTISSLLSNPNVSHQDVISAVSGLVDQGVLKPEQGAQMVRSLPGSPQGLRQFLIQQGLQTMDSAKRLELLIPKAGTYDAGNRLIPTSTDQLTGVVTQGAPVQKAPEGYTIAPDGTLAVDPGFLAAKTAIAKAGKTAVNLNVNTDKTLTSTLAKGVGEQLDAGLSGANSAVDTIQSARNLKQILKSGKVITGPGADTKVTLLQVGRALGVTGADADEILSNTRAVVQGLAQGELTAAQGMKGQGAMSDSERALVKRVAGGDINLSTPELMTLTSAIERNAMARVKTHQANVDRLKGVPGAESLLPFYSAPQIPTEVQPATPQPAAPAQVPNWQSAGYASEAQAVQDAMSAIQRGADKAAVIQRLEQAGIRNHGIR